MPEPPSASLRANHVINAQQSVSPHFHLKPQQGEIMANPFVYTELNTTDVGTSKAFYSKLFDWNLEDVPGAGMDYTFIKNGDNPIGGMMKHPMPGAPSMWLPYVGVDDINAATAKAKSLGAKVIVDVREVMGHGQMSVLSDPTGATIALWQARK
jgi:uncharacterized protein